jgi:hypothetical protein
MGWVAAEGKSIDRGENRVDKRPVHWYIRARRADLADSRSRRLVPPVSWPWKSAHRPAQAQTQTQTFRSLCCRLYSIQVPKEQLPYSASER